MGVIHTGLMYILLYSAIQKLPTHLTGALSFIYPVAALAVDRIAFGHQLQPVAASRLRGDPDCGCRHDIRLDITAPGAASGGLRHPRRPT